MGLVLTTLVVSMPFWTYGNQDGIYWACGHTHALKVAIAYKKPGLMQQSIEKKKRDEWGTIYQEQTIP